MDSSSVRAASRCAKETLSADFEFEPRGTASTLCGPRGPQRAPAQYAPARRTRAIRMMRTGCVSFFLPTGLMVVVLGVLPGRPCPSETSIIGESKTEGSGQKRPRRLRQMEWEAG